jgi:hypothetical protein
MSPESTNRVPGILSTTFSSSSRPFFPQAIMEAATVQNRIILLKIFIYKFLE